MSLKIYTIEENQQWDEIVKSFQTYDVYWLSGYVKAFKIHGDGEPLLFFYEDKNVRGINVVMKRDISKDQHFANKIKKDDVFDLVTPYGYGGWLIEGSDETDLLFCTYEKWCRDNNVVSEFVRYHPVLGNHKAVYGKYDVVELGDTIALNLMSPEIIWKNFTSKNRNMIRKAEKAGIKVYNGRYPQIYEIFRKIYNATMDRDHADSYYYFEKDFYKSLLEDLPQNAQIFYSELDGEVIAASVILEANGKLNYHLSGSIREFQHLAPTNLMLYKAALWGCENGCCSFHLGGGVGSKEDSLYKFKKAFYRETPCKFYIGKKIFSKEQYKTLVNMREDLHVNSYFPEYRA